MADADTTDVFESRMRQTLPQSLRRSVERPSRATPQTAAGVITRLPRSERLTDRGDARPAEKCATRVQLRPGAGVRRHETSRVRVQAKRRLEVGVHRHESRQIIRLAGYADATRDL